VRLSGGVGAMSPHSIFSSWVVGGNRYGGLSSGGLSRRGGGMIGDSRRYDNFGEIAGGMMGVGGCKCGGAVAL